MNRPIRRLFADIETSPNVGFFWEPGHQISISYDNIIRERAVICIGYKWEGESQVHTLTWDARQNDKAMLREFAKVIAEADEVIAHNGDRFDWKWLRTRCLKHGLPLFREVKTVDTLKIAWSKFRFNSSRLDYLAKFLGIPGKPATGFGLWKRVIAKDAAALKQMVSYCAGDVLMVEAVYKKLVPAAKPATHLGVFQGKPVWSCPRCGSTNVRKSKTRVSPSGALQHQMRCNDCGEYYTISNTAFRAYEKAKRK